MKTLFVILMIMVFVLAPVMAIAQNYSSGGSAIAQPVVHEGTVEVRTGEGLKVGTTASEVEGENLLVYPDNTVVSDYNNDYGPPAVTYYAPPYDYAYLYSGVPYPFWGWNSWYPGFFAFGDFDRLSFDDHGRHFVNNRVIGPSEVRRDAERAFTSEHNGVRFDADRSRTSFNGHREVRSGTREVNRENRTFVSSTGKTFNFSASREGTVVTPSERGRNFNGPAERTFRPSSNGGGYRELNSTPGSYNSGARSGRGSTFSPASGHRNFSPSSGGMRGGRMGGSFGGRHGR